LLCRPSWPWIHDLPASTSWVLIVKYVPPCLAFPDILYSFNILHKVLPLIYIISS
jgi:hypothetical protein